MDLRELLGFPGKALPNFLLELTVGGRMLFPPARPLLSYVSSEVPVLYQIYKNLVSIV